MKMTGRNIISRELAESIRQCLGRKVKLNLKALVRYEIKGDKTENRVLAFASCRLFVLTAKVPTRVDQHFHYLDIQSLESKRPNQLTMTVCDRSYTYLTTGEEGNSHEVDQMLMTLATALKNIFPSVPLTHIIRKVEVEPNGRLRCIRELEDAMSNNLSSTLRSTLGSSNSSSSSIGPCGGFSTQYMCMCDYHALPFREEVAWDVDNIYMSHDTRELYLHDFDYLEQKDLIAIISALEYNMWFTRLRASHTKLSQEAVQRLLHMLTKSLSMEELYLDNIAAKPEFAHKLSLSLLANSALPLQKLDLSNNPIEDKGALHISNPIGRQSKGLAHLNLSSCSLTSKGVNMLAHSLTVNKFMSQTLTYLNLSGNSLKDDINNLFNFLAQPNVLTLLDLSGTDCAIDALFGALVRGCTTHLATLKLSRNNFSTGGSGSSGGVVGSSVVGGGSSNKKLREMLPSFKQYFTSTLALKTLNLAHCKMPPDALKNVLLGLACNESISGVEVDLSSNHLSSTGAQILESCIHGVTCLHTLHIQDNGLESNLGPVMTAISRNKSIKTLSVGRNLNTIKSKHVGQVVDAIVHLLQEEDCSLESLSINDSKLKTELQNILNALGSNNSLQFLDITGNYMGDGGARLLAKALQINTKLQHICFDKNSISLQGFTDIAYALQNNYSLKFLPFPLHDVSACMKTAPERTDTVMRRIQDALQRNIAPARHTSQAQALRLHQGFLLNSTQQQVAKLVLQSGEAARTLKRTQAGSGELPVHIQELCATTDSLIADAEHSKQLIHHLQDVVVRRNEAGNPVDTRLQQMAQELHSVIATHLQDTSESMLRAAQDRCPTLLADPRSVEHIRQACVEKAQVPASVIHNAIVNEAGSAVLNSVSEVNLNLAATVSEHVIDRVVQALSTTCRTMSGEPVTGGQSSAGAAVVGGGGGRKRASTGSEMGRERGSSESSRSERSGAVTPSHEDNTSQKSTDPSPMATPQLASKRKSIQGRKLRPQSVVGAAESLGSVGELPSRVGQQLKHLVKQRPRRAKTRQATRPMGLASVLPEEDDITQGVETFFRGDTSTPSTPLLLSPDSEHSGRLGKYEWNSSMESFPVKPSPAAPVSVGPNSGIGGSTDSLTRSESLLVSESDTARDSPSFATHDTDDDDNAVFDESNEAPSSRRRVGTGSSMTRLSVKLSPDHPHRKTFTGLLNDSSGDMDGGGGVARVTSTAEEDEVRKVAGLAKIGLGYGGNIMAEIRARQEKRTSVLARDDDCDGMVGSLSQHLLSGVKLRANNTTAGGGGGAAAPPNGFPRPTRGLHSPEECSSPRGPSTATSPQPPSSTPSPSSLRLLSSKPPPPKAPKPRPHSAALSPDQHLHHQLTPNSTAVATGVSPGDGGACSEDDEGNSIRSRTSVRQMAANLAGSKDEASTPLSRTTSGGRKAVGGPGATGSLPRSPNIPPFGVQSGVGVSAELLSALDKRRTTINNNSCTAPLKDQQQSDQQVSVESATVQDLSSGDEQQCIIGVTRTDSSTDVLLSPVESSQPPDYPPPPPPLITDSSQDSSSGGSVSLTTAAGGAVVTLEDTAVCDDDDVVNV